MIRIEDLAGDMNPAQMAALQGGGSSIVPWSAVIFGLAERAELDAQ